MAESLNKKLSISDMENLKNLTNDSKDFYLNDNIPVIFVPSPLDFYRDWVAPNKPVIVEDCISHWPALKLWQNDSYLKEKYGDLNVTVAITPNGYADAPLNDLFVMPEEVTMKFGEFLDVLNLPDDSKVHYIQKQNSNMMDEFETFCGDVEKDIKWATEAFGKLPDAVNFWMGEERAITSMHKDGYENIYCVVKGYKDFILIPPTDLPWIPYKLYPPAKYNLNSDKFSVEKLNSPKVPWICIDPLNPNCNEFPLYRNANVIKCRVSAGQALYLPSLWFHHVMQSHGCIAVNYWYDMEYDVKYVYHSLLKNICWKEIIS